MNTCQIGDLVHIPQAVQLIDCDIKTLDNSQLAIPFRTEYTKAPQVGVVTEVSQNGAYVRVFYQGTHWSIKDTNVYRVGVTEK